MLPVCVCNRESPDRQSSSKRTINCGFPERSQIQTASIFHGLNMAKRFTSKRLNQDDQTVEEGAGSVHARPLSYEPTVCKTSA